MFRVQIIILNYNGREMLPLCLPSLVEAARKSSHPTGVTVLDNRSTDEGLAWVRNHCPEVRIVTAPKNLFLISFNDYLRKIPEEIVILMNNDIRVEPDFVDPLVRVFDENPDAFLASPQCFSFDGRRYEGGRTRAEIRWGLFWSSAIFPGYENLKEKPGFTFASGFGAFHRQRLLSLGGYDDLYLPGIMEDADLGFRAWREGYRSYYVPTSRIYHRGQASFKKAFGQKGILTLAHRNTFLFMWKNLTDSTVLMPHFIFLIPRLLLAFARRRSEFVVGFFRALRRLPEALRKRKFPSKRARNDREIFSLANEKPLHRPYRFKKKWKGVLAGIFDLLGTVLFLPFTLLRRPSSLNPRKILIIRTDSLGDGVLTLPAVQALAERFPAAEIDFLVNPVTRDLFAHFYPAARIHLLEKNNWRVSFKEIQSRRYDLGIDFRGDLRTILLMFLAGIPHRWGRGGTGGGFLLTHPIPNPYQRHEILENLELVLENGVLPRVEFPSVALDSANPGTVGGKKILIHMGAGYPSKRWAADNFIEVAKRIRDAQWGTPIFIGTQSERELLNPYRGRLGNGFVDLTGRTSLKELLEVLGQADLFIGNDSGPAHLAALTGVKMLLIFSGTNDYRQWAPWSSQLRIIHRPVPCSPCEERTCPLPRQICLEEISPDEVFRTAGEMLGR